MEGKKGVVVKGGLGGGYVSKQHVKQCNSSLRPLLSLLGFSLAFPLPSHFHTSLRLPDCGCIYFTYGDSSASQPAIKSDTRLAHYLLRQTSGYKRSLVIVGPCCKTSLVDVAKGSRELSREALVGTAAGCKASLDTVAKAGNYNVMIHTKKEILHFIMKEVAAKQWML